MHARLNQTLLYFTFIVLVSLNIAWQHQTLLTQMVPIREFYDDGWREPFLYRLLLRLPYVLIFSNKIISINLNSPFANSAEVFQLAVDFLSLFVLFLSMKQITKQFYKNENISKITSTMTTIIIITFGYFYVPNRTLFYPYDFLELSLFSIFIAIALKRSYTYDIIALVVLFFGVANKETIVFGFAFYVIIRFGINIINCYLVVNFRIIALCISGVIIALMSKYICMYAATYVLKAPNELSGDLAAFQLFGNLRQILNPLFIFSIVGVFSYLYIPIIFLRKKLDWEDATLLIVVALWCFIMVNVGIVRELRIFAPMSIVLYYINLKVLRTWVLLDPAIEGLDRRPLIVRDSAATLSHGPVLQVESIATGERSR